MLHVDPFQRSLRPVWRSSDNGTDAARAPFSFFFDTARIVIEHSSIWFIIDTPARLSAMGRFDAVPPTTLTLILRENRI